MCGIFGILNETEISDIISKSFELGKNRGPENSKLERYGNSIVGFHK